MRSSASSTLSDHSDSVPASPQPTVRTKRWASESEVDFDRDDTEDVQPLKRARPSAGGFGDPVSAKPSPSDKDDRKRARMMRNRNAAQASRDRKKEHTNILEARCAELEAQLKARSNVTAPEAPRPRARAQASIAAPVLSARALKVTLRPAGSTAPDEQLEVENEELRAKLLLEQQVTASLRARLEGLEDKFALLSEFLSPTSPPSPQPFFEPTFTFDAEDQKPSPEALLLASTTTTDSSRLVAAEAVPLVNDASMAPLASPSPPRSLLAPPLPPLPTAPAEPVTPSFVTIADAWDAWRDSLELGGAAEIVHDEENYSSDDFLNLDYLHDAPLALVY